MVSYEEQVEELENTINLVNKINRYINRLPGERNNKNTGNNGKGNNESRDEWETPNWLFNKLNEQYDFYFDCCASENNTKCLLYATKFMEIKKLTEISWMNPPFSKAKEMFEHFFKVINKGVAIYRCDNMETSIWQKIIFPNADWIFIFDKRINYEGESGKGARFPSALIGIGVETPKEFEGSVLLINKLKNRSKQNENNKGRFNIN
jgi:hypothetical protein